MLPGGPGGMPRPRYAYAPQGMQGMQGPMGGQYPPQGYGQYPPPQGQQRGGPQQGGLPQRPAQPQQNGSMQGRMGPQGVPQGGRINGAQPTGPGPQGVRPPVPQQSQRPGGYKGREEPQQQQSQQSGGLTAAQLANAAPAEQKQMLGEALYPKIAASQPDLAGKITGMLLEMDTSELIYLIENDEALTAKVSFLTLPTHFLFGLLMFCHPSL